MSYSKNVTRTTVSLGLFALVTLPGCGSLETTSNSPAPNQLSGATQILPDQQQAQRYLESRAQVLLARQETLATGTFEATVNFSKPVSSYAAVVSDLSVPSFLNLNEIFANNDVTAQRTPATASVTFSSSYPRVEAFNVLVDSDTAINDDGMSVTLRNTQNQEVFTIGLSPPSGPNVSIQSQTLDPPYLPSSVYYFGDARLPSGWTINFARSLGVRPETNPSLNYRYKAAGRIFLQASPPASHQITISNMTVTQAGANRNFDFDISTTNTTLKSWSVEIQKDNATVKTFSATTDSRGPGVGSGTNPVHVQLPWDGLNNLNQSITGNVTWVAVANTTTFSAGGAVNDEVDSVQAKLDDNLDPPELSILKADSETLLASSSPEPYPGSSIDAIAALDGALGGIGTLAANFLDLSKSNDQMTIDLPASIKIRYVVKRTPQTENLSSVDVSVTTSQSNKTSLTRTLQRKRDLDTPQNLRFESTLRLVSGTPQGDEIGLKNFPKSFTTFDYNAGDGVTYEDGNAQDGLEWERRETAAGGTQLGRAAKLKPSEKASRSYRSTIPPTASAIQAAGFEDLIVERQSLKAWTRVKNQAHSLYVSSHGLTTGDLFADDVSTVPASAVQPTWSNGNLDLAIFAGCSVLDIGNFNGWTNLGAGGSPGLQWKSAGRPASSVRPGCIFLGYNATAPLGNVYEPAGSLHGDTRILGFYYDQLGQQSNPASPESKAMAWLLANAGMEQRIADDACSITDDYYYFIRTKSFNANHKEIRDPHAQNDDGSYTTERAIWKVHRSQWSKVGKASFDSIPLSASGKILMRRLPAARMGESGKI